MHNWRSRHADFPEPVLVLTNVLVWYWPEVEDWLARSGRVNTRLV